MTYHVLHIFEAIVGESVQAFKRQASFPDRKRGPDSTKVQKHIGFLREVKSVGSACRGMI
jgi:hypothetical protein